MLGYSENRIIAEKEKPILTFNHNNVDNQISITVVCHVYGTIEINWGDGWVDIVDSLSSYEHTYQGVGEQTVTISGDITNFKGFRCNGFPIYNVSFFQGNDYSNLEELNLERTAITDLYLVDTISNLNYLALKYNDYLASVDINSLISVGDVIISFNPVLESIAANQLQTSSGTSGFVTSDSNSLIYVDIPNLQTISGRLNIQNCPNLVTVNLGKLNSVNRLYSYNNAIQDIDISTIKNVSQLRFYNSGLTQEEVDDIIHQCLDISLSDTSVYLWVDNAGTGSELNEPPSAAGLSDINTLRSRGWLVWHA